MTKSAARERAMGLLYEADQREESVADVLAGLAVPPDPYAVSLLEGVVAHLAKIDGLLEHYSRNWTLERMPQLDRAVLRLATYELLCTDVPTAVVLDEAVELAKGFSTDDSGRFVNGVLASVANEVRPAPPSDR